MEKNRIVPLIYGYAVCLVTIIVTFISLSMIVGSIINLQDPLRANANRFSIGPTANLSSYEAYKIDVLTGRNSLAPVSSDGKPSTPAYTPSETELKTAYETAKADHIAAVKQDSTKSIANGLSLLIVAVLLFFTHWRWLTRFNEK